MSPENESTQQPRILGLRKNIFLLGFTSLLNDFSSEMVFSIFPAFFTTVLKTGAESLGLVDGIAEGLSNIFKIYSGSFSDRVGKRKPLVVLGYAISVAARPFYVFAGSVASVLGLRVLDRVGKGFRDAPRDAIISLSAPKEELGFSFGYHRAMDTTGAILGPLAAFAILAYFPMRFDIVFLSSFGIGILALMTLIWISDVAVGEARPPLSLRGAWQALSPQFKMFLWSMVFLSVGTLPIAILLLKTTSLGLTVASIPLFYMLYNVTYASFSVSAGRMSDNMGARRVVALGYLILLAAYAVLYVAVSLTMLVLGFLILGLFVAFTDGVSRALASELTAEGERGNAMGLLRAANGLGALGAGVLGGFLWQQYGQGTAYAVSAVLVLIGLAVLFMSLPKRGSAN